MVALRAFVLGGVYDVVSAYPRCPCAGFYWVKEYTGGFIPWDDWRGVSWRRGGVTFFKVFGIFTGNLGGTVAEKKKNPPPGGRGQPKKGEKKGRTVKKT